MATTMCLEYLPLEVLEVIVTFLSAEDLAHCLCVSRTWYNIFSNDIFWRRHCTLNARDYFSITKCLVEPVFKPPPDIGLPIHNNRLEFLQEQHLWKNWNSGRFTMEEIEFDCDDTISYNIKFSFLDNDHICLHRTFETEVWNISETPFSVMAIPYCLKELWEENVYKVVEKNLYVIQCNVVQVYTINLDSSSWSLDNVFFFNKPEVFSSAIDEETDVDALFQVEDISEEINFERIICDQYLVGANMDEESPVLHVWNIKTGKKLKEDKCMFVRGGYSFDLKAPKKSNTRILVTFKLEDGPGGGNCEKFSIVYDFLQLQFIMSTRQQHTGDVLYFDGYSSIVDDTPLKVLSHYDESTKNGPPTCLPDYIQNVSSIKPLGDNLLISTRNELFSITMSEPVAQNASILRLMEFNFELCHICVLFNRYVLLHITNFQSVKELWKVGNPFRVIIEFSSDSGTYAAANNACSKIALEKGNKLIILNFW